MALNYLARYSGQFAVDANYPQGKPQNVVVEGDGNGSPFEADLLADIFGMLQGLLLAAGITPSGTPDHANASQYKEAVAFIASSANASLDPRHPSFGAVGNGTTDDTSAINSAIAALSAAGGGTLDLNRKTYRVTGTLTCKPDVSVRNGTLRLDAAAVDYFLSFTDAGSGAVAAVWENVTLAFDDQNATLIYNPSAAVRVHFRNCFLDCSTGAANAPLLYSDAASHFIFEECEGNLPLAGQGFFTSAAKLQIVKGVYRTPLGFANFIVNGTGGEHDLDQVKFDTSATTGGGAICVNVGGQRVFAKGCRFIAGGSNVNVAFACSLSANVGFMVESDSDWGTIIPYDFDHYLADGSRLGLKPWAGSSSNSDAATVPATAQSFSQRFTNPSTSPPVVTVDPPLYWGQPMSLMIGNDHTSAWIGKIVLAGVQYDDADAALEDLAANSQVFFNAHLRAQRYEGALFWLAEDMNQVVLV